MPLVQAKCESCGGNLTVDSNLKAANCPFCGTAYVVQDAINHYNTSVTIEHLHADVVNISDESSSEGRLRAADALMKMNKYGEAEREYLTVTRLAPQNYRGWYGLIESHTCRFTRRLIKRSEFNMLNDYANSLITFAPAGQCDAFIQRFKEYLNSERVKNTVLKNELYSKLNAEELKVRTQEQECMNLNTIVAQIGERKGQVYVKSRTDQSSSKSTAIKVLYGLGGFVGLIGLILCIISYKLAGAIFLVMASFNFFIAIMLATGDFRRSNELKKLENKYGDYCGKLSEANARYRATQSNIYSYRNELEQIE